jgi:hypothetical protein
MEPNLAVSIYVRSSIKFLHFVPFGLQSWLPRLIIFSDWVEKKSWLIYPAYRVPNTKLEAQPTEPVSLT